MTTFYESGPPAACVGPPVCSPPPSGFPGNLGPSSYTRPKGGGYGGSFLRRGLGILYDSWEVLHSKCLFSWLFERRMSTVCGGMWIVDAANSYGHISNFLRLNVCLLVFFKGILCQLNFLGRPVWISRYFQFSTTFDGLRRGLALGSF